MKRSGFSYRLSFLLFYSSESEHTMTEYQQTYSLNLLSEFVTVGLIPFVSSTWDLILGVVLSQPLYTLFYIIVCRSGTTASNKYENGIVDLYYMLELLGYLGVCRPCRIQWPVMTNTMQNNIYSITELCTIVLSNQLLQKWVWCLISY